MNDPNLNAVPAIQAIDSGGEVNVREIFDILWSGKWVITLIAFLVFTGGVLFCSISVPIFQANGLVLIEKNKSQLNASIDQLSSLIGSAPGEAASEVAIIKSRMILNAVAENLKLDIVVTPKAIPFFGEAILRHRKERSEPASPPFDFLAQYAWGGEKIVVTALDVPSTWLNRSLALISTQSGYDLFAEGVLLLSGRVGERAISKNGFSIFVQDLVARPGTIFYVKHLAPQSVYSSLTSGLIVAEQPKESGVISIKYEADSPVIAAKVVNEIQSVFLRQNVERRSAQAQQSLEFLKTQLPQIKQKADEAQAKLNSYQLAKGSVDVQRETELVLNQAVNLEAQRQSLTQQREAALQRFTSQHPVVITLTEQIRAIEQEQINIKRQVEALPETQQEILSLMRDLEVNTQLYTGLLNSAQELQVTKAGTVGSVRVIDSGLPGLSPIKPQKKVILGISAVAGLLLGIATVFTLRAMLRGVDRPEDVERVLGLPTYASVPYSQAQRGIVARLRNRSADNLMLASLDPGDLAIEALRGLRTSLYFAMMEAENNIVMLTGPIASLGKSFITINLGAVLALSGKRVVVIDADLRRGYLQRYVGVNQKPGLSDGVAGTADMAGIISKTALDTLDFIPCGTRPPNPSEVLMSERFSELLRTLSRAYDYVLIDTPPVLPVTDAAIVGRLAGCSFVVLKSAEHPMRAIQETVKRLKQAGVSVRGTIFNQVGARLGSYGYGTYGYSYGYSTYGYGAK